MLQGCRHDNLVQLKRVVTGSKLDRWVMAVVLQACSGCRMCTVCICNALDGPWRIVRLL